LHGVQGVVGSNPAVPTRLEDDVFHTIDGTTLSFNAFESSLDMRRASFAILIQNGWQPVHSRLRTTKS
jgi:hypothetical protein